MNRDTRISVFKNRLLRPPGQENDDWGRPRHRVEDEAQHSPQELGQLPAQHCRAQGAEGEPRGRPEAGARDALQCCREWPEI